MRSAITGNFRGVPSSGSTSSEARRRNWPPALCLPQRIEEGDNAGRGGRHEKPTATEECGQPCRRKPRRSGLVDFSRRCDFAQHQMQDLAYEIHGFWSLLTAKIPGNG